MVVRTIFGILAFYTTPLVHLGSGLENIQFMQSPSRDLLFGSIPPDAEVTYGWHPTRGEEESIGADFVSFQPLRWDFPWCEDGENRQAKASARADLHNSTKTEGKSRRTTKLEDVRKPKMQSGLRDCLIGLDVASEAAKGFTSPWVNLSSGNERETISTFNEYLTPQVLLTRAVSVCNRRRHSRSQNEVERGA